MSDKHTPQQRRTNMSAIRGKDTKPEIIVRRFLWSHGYRYRLNHHLLPGKPDIVLRQYKTCIFVNGCFWHGHKDCKYYTIPKTNTQFWMQKVSRNQKRDHEVVKELSAMGWNCITIWECELKPTARNATLSSLLYTLSKIYLNSHKSQLYIFDEEQATMQVADEQSG